MAKLSIQTKWTDGGPITIQAVSVNPTKGSSVLNDKLWYRRDGQDLIVRLEYRQNSAGTGGTGDYLFTVIPPALTGLTIDSTRIAFYTTNIGYTANRIDTPSCTGSGTSSAGSASAVLVAIPYDSTRVRLAGILSDNTNGNVIMAISPSGMGLGSNPVSYAAEFRVPITQWR